MVIKSFQNHALAINGRLFKTARVRDEPYSCLEDPEAYVLKLKKARIGADLFTFMQEIKDNTPRYPFRCGRESLAVLPITTYETWWKTQIKDKTRNMVRKSQKAGVQLRSVEFNDEFVKGVVGIYNESPIRQGKPFKHFGKSFEAIKSELSTFPDRSNFVGALLDSELIGFCKLVEGKDVASLMHIISRIAARDKAPTDGLLAKAVEICAARNIPFLHYGVWSKRGMGAFKRHHGFVQRDIPRYYVPLNLRGRLILRLQLHRRLVEFLPDRLADGLVLWRNRWNRSRSLLVKP